MLLWPAARARARRHPATPLSSPAAIRGKVTVKADYDRNGGGAALLNRLER